MPRSRRCRRTDRGRDRVSKKKKSEVFSDDFTKPVSEAAGRKFLTMDNGAVYEVVSEDGKYFRCGATQFRKNNPHILKVEEARYDG